MKFKTIQSEIIVTFVTIIIGIQLIGLIPVGRSINENAYKSAENDLKIGTRVFKNILEQNTANLTQGAKILAADYGFKASIASFDSETIISALNNHQARINADIAIFSSTHSDDIIVSGNLSKSDAGRVVSRLISKYKNNDQSLDFEVFNAVPYQLVAVPVKAPLTIGWVVMGFKIDNVLANKLQKLTNLQVTFVQKTKNNAWSVAGTTLSNQQSQLLSVAVAQHYKNKILKFDFEIEDAIYDSSVIFLHQGDRVIMAVLQQSLTKAIANYQSLKTNLLLLLIVGLIIFIVATIYLSKYISAPIKSLSETAKQLELGNYDTEVKTSRSDEIGNLSQSFNAMREAIALREKKVSRLAFWDETTGLINRVAFLKAVNEVTEQDGKQQNSLAIIVFNIDRFKMINKILGRAFADKLLALIAEKLTAAVRKSSDVVARIGADEFGILLTDADEAGAMKVAEALRRIFDVPLQIDEQSIDVSMRGGMSLYPDHATDTEKLLINAETALQVSKIKKSGMVLYDATYEKAVEANLTLVSQLKKAIADNELVLFIQPKVNFKTKAVDTAEALIRWQHPDKGMVFPDQFIPYAEELGIIQKITHWMLTEACKTVVALKAKGITLKIAINVSTRDLIDQQLSTIIADLFNHYQIGPEAISLEITESSVMDDPVRSEQTLRKLSEMGLHIAIDDYGTGYSSLAYLKRLPVQELKIDKSFVLKVDQNEHDATIVRSTIDLGHNLNMKVVAEGIENQASWDMLNAMGCDFGQGYLMAKPMPVSAFEDWHVTWIKKASQKVA
jgi:diguanylate cyclase